MRRPGLAVALVLFAGPAAAEVFRCVDVAGNTHFTDDAAACERPEAVRLHRELVRPSAAEAPAAAAPGAEPDAGPIPDLEALFLPATALGGAWEALREAPETPDTELRRLGLRASAARHYTRFRGPVSEVCSVELWAFTGAAQARAAAGSLRRDDWKILQAGDTLVLLHGMRVERGVGTTRGLVPGCATLGERTRGRVEAAAAAPPA